MKYILVLFLLIFVRITSVFLIKTFFSPDEYWQSLEVAHRMIFGYGHLTWEWTKGIRSYFYPTIIAGIYKVLDVLKIDSRIFIILLPRIFEALLAAFADYRFYVWCGRKKWSLFIIITSWFWFYTGSRTFINSFEAALTTIALSFFPWNDHNENTGFLWITALLTFIRPTSALTWLPLCFYHVKKSKYPVWELLIKRYLFIGLLIGGLLVALDSYNHASLIVTPYEFFKVNILEGVGSFYGTHPWYWYFSTGLPAILGIGIIPFFLSIFVAIQSWNESRSRQYILLSIILTIFGYSLLPHKEFRFLLQILPLCLYCITQFLSDWSRTKSTLLIWLVAIVILVSNIVPAGYLGFVHQQGTIKAMDKLAEIASDYKTENGKPAKIFFMMPCHSTPYYSHIHQNVTLRFLTCEPNFKKVDNYLDEADKFFEAPMIWIRKNLPVHPIDALPTHVVIFDTLAPRINDFLSIYKPLEIFFHADHLVSPRSGKNVIIYERIEHVVKKKPEQPVQKQEEQEIRKEDEIQDEL